MSGRLVRVLAGRLALAVAVVACSLLGSAVAPLVPPAPVIEAGPSGQIAPAAGPGQSADAVEVVSGDLVVRVSRQPWAIEARVGPNVVFQELAGAAGDTHYGTLAYGRGGSWFHVTSVVGVESIPGGQRLLAATSEPGAGPARVEITASIPSVVRVQFTPPAGAPVAWTVSSAVSGEGETLLGLGERFDGVSLAGRRTELWAADRREVGYGDSTYLPVPWVLSSRGFGFLLDDTRRTAWEMRSQRGDAWSVGTPGQGLAYYLVAGQPAQAIERYTALTGRPPLPPPWGLGVVKTAVGGEARVLADAARLKASGIPVDGLYVYDATDDEANMGWPHVTFEPVPGGIYPDVKRLTTALRAMGIRPLGYFGPDFRPERQSRGQADRLGFLVRGADGKSWVSPQYGISLIDVTNPKAVEWWTDVAFKRALVDLGFDGGMLDLGEAIVPDTQLAGRSGGEMHNAYTVAYTGAGYGALKKHKPDGLLWMRTGFTGGQQHHAATWSGDPVHSWDPVTGFKSIVPAGLSAGLAGYAYWHTEVGGYVDGVTDPASERDLYVRWLELAAFTPMLRDNYGDRHGNPTYTWSDETTIALWRKYARIHQALGPYLWNAAQQAQATGMPLIRHLAIGYPDDPRAWAEEQQYMLGDDLLVAPVVEPLARERTLYLPKGQWSHWWTGRIHTGPGDVTVPAPQGQIPVFVREGAASPLPDPGTFDG
jgi:alpha-glucosidase (family GH31 glycosyl hydrolase)